MLHRFCRRCWRRCSFLPAVLATNFLPITKSASISSWQHSYPTSHPFVTCTRPRNAGGLQSAPRSSGLQLLHALRQCSLFASSDTVFALSSGHGKCGVAVVRVSGSHALEVGLISQPDPLVHNLSLLFFVETLKQITRLESSPQPRKALLRKLSDPQSGDTIDHSLVLWFPAPYSFTGEDMVEFQVHGGPSVVLALLSALSRIPGCRQAEPGDFTKRAFFNGKLDLTEVEGLADLIHAETEAQRKQALRQMEGDLGKMYEKWSKDLLKNVAHVEAVIDFGEDENIEEGLLDRVRSEVIQLQREITEHLNDGRRGERLRSGIHVTIVGAPNAGKSSLLNILCQRPAAIVSPYAGTTRDVLESTLDIFGYPIILSDTAGLREAQDPVEKEGVLRALKRAETADLKILIADLSLLTEHLSEENLSITLSDLARKLLALQSSSTESWTATALEAFNPEDTIIVLNKTDLVPHELIGRGLDKSIQGTSICWMSCKTGDGVESFLQTMKTHFEHLCGNPLAGNPSLTQARHRQHLASCAESLDKFQGLIAQRDNEAMLDIAAEELRTAIKQLGRITGKVGVEEILDVVFKDFCIGK